MKKSIVFFIALLSGILVISITGYLTIRFFRPGGHYEGRWTGTVEIAQWEDKTGQEHMEGTITVTVDFDEQSRTYGHMRLRFPGLPDEAGLFPVQYRADGMSPDPSAGEGLLVLDKDRKDMRLIGDMQIEDEQMNLAGRFDLHKTDDPADVWE